MENQTNQSNLKSKTVKSKVGGSDSYNNISLQSILEKLQNIEQALTGNAIGNDGGLVGRIRDLEDENIKQQQEIRDMRDDINKFKWIGTVIFGIPTVITIAKLLFDLVK